MPSPIAPKVSHAGGDAFRIVPLESFRVLAFESPGQRPAGVDRAVAFFPAAPQFIRFSARNLLTGRSISQSEVAAVEIEGHGADCILNTDCPPLPAEPFNSL